MKRVVAGLCAVFLLAAGCGGGNDVVDTRQPEVKNMKLACSSFNEGEMIPKKHTGEGEDVSPPLGWADVPENTTAFVVICDDPDAPAGTWTHWVLYDIPPDVTALDEGIPMTDTVLGSARQGLSDFGDIGYRGPMPPPGKPHRYFFKLYALDAPTGLPAGSTKDDVIEAIDGHILGQGQLVGVYQR
jgi:Raf kinase inhibitor-like YbhB/YbcL family protein